MSRSFITLAVRVDLNTRKRSHGTTENWDILEKYNVYGVLEV